MILDRLRDGTRDVHERVERRLPLLDPALTLARYRDALVALHALQAPLERRLAGVRDLERWIPDLAGRRRAPLLAADLRALGAPPSLVLAEAPALPPVDDVPTALGVLYVLEGATLGGEVIARHVTGALPVTRTDGCAYFALRGRRVGPAWRAFRRALERYAAGRDAPAADAVVAGARAAFLAFDAGTATLR